MPRVLRIFGTLAAVVAAYGAYAVIAVPLIEPPAGTRWESPPSLTGDGANRMDAFRSLFPPDAWEPTTPGRLLNVTWRVEHIGSPGDATPGL